tara:strand:- start:43 stop:990 length:948 start_codon:yes stop_codon:yes gene_type:complete
MRKLHVFGDSFAAPNLTIWGNGKGLTYEKVVSDPSVRNWDPDNPEDYKEIIASKLNAEIISDTPWTAVAGASEDIILRGFLQRQSNILPDDIVLIVPTDPIREYLIPLIPTTGNVINLKNPSFRELMISDYDLKLHPMIRTQMKIAIEYNDHIAVDSLKINSLVVQYYAKMAFYQKMLNKIGCRYIIIPGQSDIIYSENLPRWEGSFDPNSELEWDTDSLGLNIHNNHIKILGSLKRISFNEIKDLNDHQNIMNGKDYWNGIDKRRNHLSRNNHIILAEKIIDSLNNNTNLDLSVGFDKSFITRENCLDSKFIIN